MGTREADGILAGRGRGCGCLKDWGLGAGHTVGHRRERQD